jgi:uncharacterized protein (DUF2141 family)
MKFRIAHLLFIAAFAATSAQAAELTVKVTDIRVQKGQLMLAVYDTADAWNGKGEPVATQSLDASANEITFHFDGLAAGTYAVAAMHDENGNGKLDTNFMGMPTEGYGFSNNPQVMRRATFEEASVVVGAEGASIDLRLR